MKVQKRRAKRITIDKGQASVIRHNIPLDSEAQTRRQKQEEKLLNTVAEIILNIIMEEDKR